MPQQLHRHLHLRALILIGVFSISAEVLSQQYNIFGWQMMHRPCKYWDYSVITDFELVETKWFINPPGIYVPGDLYSASIRYPAPGVYILTIISTTIDGQVLRDSFDVTLGGEYPTTEVLGCYVLEDTAGCYKVCAGSTVLLDPDGNAQFEVSGAESYDYKWNGLEVTWGDAGAGTVNVYYQDECESTLCFEILPLPVAEFKTTPSAINDTVRVCQGQEIFFENLTFNGLAFSWDFGDGEKSTQFNAVHSFENAGLYTVILSAETICSCAAQKEIIVEVLPAESPELDCINSICPGTRQRYTATSTGCTTYDWSVSGNGTIVNGGGVNDDFIEIVWNAGPEGIIELSVDNCLSDYCSSATIFRIPVITADGPISGDTEVCQGSTSSYEVPFFPGTQYQWQIGGLGTISSGENTNSINVKWNEGSGPGMTSVSVQYDNCFLECGGEDVLPVRISDEFRVAGDAVVCVHGQASVSTTLIPSGTGPAVQWHIENDLGQIVYSQPGSSDVFTHTFSYPAGDYEWVATNTSPAYCNSEERFRIRVTPLPEAPLGIKGERVICPGQEYGFTIDPSGLHATTWTITDGSSVFTYRGQTCHHNFGSVPPFIVAAYHTDIQYEDCVSDPVSITLETADNYAIEGPAVVCLNGIDSFSFPHISGASYTWQIIPNDHGEVKRSDLNNVEVYWTQTGMVTLRLDACGFVFDKIINVQSLPVFNVTGPLAACGNDFVSITTDNPSLQHTWYDEDDDIVSISTTVSLSPGHYVAVLTDGMGCSNEKLFEISSLPIPSVSLSTAFSTVYCGSIPPGVEIVCNTDGSGYVYTWFKDGINIGTGDARLDITDFGTYHVEVTNQYGCTTASGSPIDKITFIECCNASDCPMIPGCDYLFQDFDIVSSGDDCRSRTHIPMWPDIVPDQTRWIIQSASQGTVAVIMADTLHYDYIYPGYYLITMTGLIDGFTYVPGVCGHYQQFIDTVRAVPDFTYHGLCTAEPITFEDLTTFLPDESIASWSWNFDDPVSGAANTSSLQDPVHIYTTGGDYNVTLTVTLASGCSVTTTAKVNITDGPVLLPEYDSLYCEHEALFFYLPGGVFNVAWNFGDVSSGIENSGAGDSLFHTYNSQGIYSVLVSAMDVFGCRSQEMFNVEIRPNTFSGDIIIAPTDKICFGDTASLTAPAGGVSWLWNNAATTEVLPATESNQYNVLIHDQYHCPYSPPPVFLTVIPQPEVIIKAREIFGEGDFGPWENSLHLCYGSEFEIQVFSSDDDVSFQWENGVIDQGLVFTAEGSNLPYPGDYTFGLLAWNSECLTDSTFIEIEIFPLPNIPQINLSGPGCSHNENILTVVNPQSGIDYQWSDGQKGISITTKSAGSFFVIAENSNGCFNKSVSRTIKHSAPVELLPGGCHLKCDPLTVCLPSISDVASWNIFRNGISFESGTEWPDDYVITEEGSYTIEVTTENGCSATSDPLDISLYTGVGSVTVITYLDVDHDGIITSADAVIPDIPVVIISEDGLHEGSSNTLSGGEFVFKDYPSATYTAHFDQDLLSSEWKIIIDSMKAQILTCDDSVIVSLLLDMNCFIAGPDLYFENCPGAEFVLGDSIWTDTGEYIMHIASATGCDSVFNVHITWPDTLEVGTTVWVDVDQNGVVSPADTVISGITIVVDAGINQLPFIGITDANGFVKGKYPSHFYYISIDSTLLPPGYSIVYGTDIIHDTVCGAADYNFLLDANCSDIYTIQFAEICTGDSLWFEDEWITDQGHYSFSLTDVTTGCDSIRDIFVTTLPVPIIQSNVDWNCISFGTIELLVAGTGPFQYEWLNLTQQDSIATGLPDGTYDVSVFDSNGCISSHTAFIEGADPLNFNVPVQYEIDAGDSVEIIVSGDIGVSGLNFDWSAIDILSCSTCSSSLAYPLSDTTITIQITDADSCVYSLETKIIIKVREDSTIFDQIYGPNVFSPNGDNINDRFTFFSRLPDVYVYELTIMDRWGEMVFHIEDIALDAFEGWDGTLRDKTMNPGVFVYFAKVKLSDGQEVRLVGDVTLLR